MNRRVFVALAALSCVTAHAQVEDFIAKDLLPPTDGLFVQGTVGANLLGMELDNNYPAAPGFEFPPTVRVGLYMPKFAVAGSLGVTAQLGPASGNHYADFTLGASIQPYIWSSHNLRAYLMGGLNGGIVFDSFYRYPNIGADLGVGAQYFLSPHWGLGIETGLRPRVLVQSYSTGGTAAPSQTLGVAGIYVALTGTWLPSVAPKATLAEAPPAEPDKEDPKRQCMAVLTDGWLEPSQGVWQDDPAFDDRPRKQLVRTEGGVAAYAAELDMVTGRDTRLYGVHHYRRAGVQVPVDSRDSIVLRGVSNCSDASAVKLKFTVREGGLPRELFLSPPLGQIPLTGAATAKATPWELRLPAGEGLPAQPFRFQTPGPYELKAEIVRDTGAATGLAVTVSGLAKVLKGPTVRFAPVLLSASDAAGQASLLARTQALATESSHAIAGLFPLPAEGLPTWVAEPHLLGDVSGLAAWQKDNGATPQEALLVNLMDAVGTSALLNDADRVVAVLPAKDFQTLFAAAPTPRVKPQIGPPPHPGTLLSQKLVVVSADANWDTVAHELVHSIPDGWSDDDMRTECGRGFHNRLDPVAHGPRAVGLTPLMGAAAPAAQMAISQCTYAHLAKELESGPPDPPVVLVRGVLFKNGTTVKGELHSLYTLWGHSDFHGAVPNGYFIVLRNELGLDINRFAFNPRWTDIETGASRRALAFGFRVPWRPDIDTIELVGPGGVLDKKKLGSKKPEVEFLAPKDKEQVHPENGKLHVTWKGKGESGHSLLYTLQYSLDDGATFTDALFEKPDTECDVAVPANGKVSLKVQVTDGSSSGKAEAKPLLR